MAVRSSVGVTEAGVTQLAPLRRRRRLGYGLYLAAALMFGINGTVSKVLLQAVSDSARVSQLRVTASFLIMLVFVALHRRQALRVTRRELPLLVAYGVLGVAMCQWLYFVAIARLPVAIALLVEFTAPVMVALWVRLGWHQPVRPTLWLGLVLALGGLALVAQVWGGFTLDGLGLAAALGAAAALAVYYLLGEVGGRARDSVSMTMWGFGFGALMWAVVAPVWTFPWQAMVGSAQPLGPGTVAVPLWMLAGYMVLFGTILPFWLVLAAIGHIGASGASIIGLTEPLIAALVAWAVLGESLAPIQLAGGAMILTGVLVAERARTPV